MERYKFEKSLKDKLFNFNINLTQSEIDLFYTYYEILIFWNKKFNLTAIEDEQEIILKHFVDSLILKLTIENEELEKVIDIGTGAGFPGVPLKIINQNLKLTLLEAQKKKVEFLKELIKELNLKDVEILWDRAENLGRMRGFRENFDLVLARGVAKPEIVLEYAVPFVKINKIYLAQTTPKSIDHWKEVSKISEMLGAKWEKEYYFSFDDNNRAVIKFRKIRSTPEKYPRKPGIPEKRPLDPSKL